MSPSSAFSNNTAQENGLDHCRFSCGYVFAMAITVSNFGSFPIFHVKRVAKRVVSLLGLGPQESDCLPAAKEKCRCGDPSGVC